MLLFTYFNSSNRRVIQLTSYLADGLSIRQRLIYSMFQQQLLSISVEETLRTNGFLQPLIPRKGR